MSFRYLAGLPALLILNQLALAADYTLEAVEEKPDDVASEIAETLNPAGVRIKGPRRALVDIWLVKELAVKEGFTPNLDVKYPLTPGQIVGVIQVPRRSELSDFRGQEIEPGTYTLRYGQQPMDGNHIGTSATLDFLLALPADDDKSTAPISVEDLFAHSAEASGTTHPAIFSLLPVEGDIKEAEVVYDESHEFWILQLVATAKETKVPMRLVIVGESEG